MTAIERENAELKARLAEVTRRLLLLERHAAVCPIWEAAEDHAADKRASDR